MKRLLWITLALAVGLIVALMIASLLLQQQAGKVVDDLRAPVASLREALLAWDRERVRACTDTITDDLYLKWFEDYHSGDARRKRMFKGILASMAAFPSVRFEGVKPDRVDVQYEVRDGAARTLVRTSLTPRPEGGWSLKIARFPVASDDNASTEPIVFREGDNVSLAATADRLFESLMSPEDFRAFMGFADNETAQAAKLLSDTRTQVMACNSDRLKRMLPVVGPLPRGTKWFQLIVSAKVDDSPLRLDFVVEPKPGAAAIIRRFQCSAGRDLPAPPVAPPADNATRTP
jgi:hypothetical protein